MSSSPSGGSSPYRRKKKTARQQSQEAPSSPVSSSSTKSSSPTNTAPPPAEQNSSSRNSSPTKVPQQQQKDAFQFPATNRTAAATSRPPDRPIHVSQDSLFSSTSGYSNYRGFLNLAVLLLVLSNARVALENVIKYGILANPLALFTYLQSDPARYLPYLVLLSSSTAFILFCLWLEIRLASGSLTDRMGAIYYCLDLSLLLLVPMLTVFYFRIDPFASMLALGIFSCIFFKLISYGHVNYWCRCASKASPGARKKTDNGAAVSAPGFGRRQMIRYPQNLTVGNIFYFMFAPTLCYELNFPRSPKIRWWFVAKRFLEALFLFQVMIILSQQWIVPLLKNSLQPFIAMDYSRMMERLLKLAIPNHVIWLMFFYYLFHSVMNLTAELMRFADREFYRDWWNSETISYFWQTWNIPVHRWALRHLYKPMLKGGFGKLGASVAVFLVSAFFHEFLVSVPLCIFRLYAFMGMLAQIPFNVLTTNILRGGKAGNIVVWCSLILGQPLAILMYLHDWYVMNYGPNLVA